jgi:membrane protease YdiL (CAAX protease family)
VYLALPALCLRLRPQKAKPLDLFHILAILCIWVPVETDLFLLIPDLALPGADLAARFSDVALLPRVAAALVPGIELPIDTLTAVLLALYSFLVRHPVRGVGLSFRIGWRDLRHAAIGLLGFAIVGLVVGLRIDFLYASPLTLEPASVALAIVSGYLWVALPEEILFRGIIQNLLSKRLRHEGLGWLIASVVFGLAHLNNATPGFPVPNWAYVLMATLAGLAYGWVWRRTKKVTASALTHMLVNLVWGIIFR